MEKNGGPRYTHAYSDSRVSGRVKLQAFPSNSRSNLGDLILSLLLSKFLLALSIHIASEWILKQGYSVFTLLVGVSISGAVGLSIWEKLWEGNRVKSMGRNSESSAPLYGLLYFTELTLFFLALSRMSVLRQMMLTSFSVLWTRGVPFSNFSGNASGRKAGNPNAIFLTTGMIFSSYFLDYLLSVDVPFIGYIYLLGNLLTAGQRNEILASHVGESGSKGKFHATGVIYTAFISIFFFLFSWLFTSHNVLKQLPITDSLFSIPAPSHSLLLPSCFFLAMTLTLIDPLLSLSHPASNQISIGYPITFMSTLVVGLIGFGQSAGLAEIGIGGIAYVAISHLTSTDPRAFSSSSTSGATTTSSNSLLSNVQGIYKQIRITIKIILKTPESKRIYFFLCLNLAYMVVQMIYGILTNSLGLISDSIHMFFDCLALGMGLFASVMATWEPNSKFTYGYSRVETLSGFANGLFLCLISIFIIFEAIQRLLDPPEMNTSQLLVVSSLGLAVNLVGMAATGGHHHHGHSHGGHDHGHDHGPKKVKEVKVEMTSHDHDHGHSHGSHDHSSHNHSSHDHSSHDHSSHDHSSHDHSSHDHSGHDHDDEEEDHSSHNHGGHSHNMKGVFLHVMADTLGSVGVIISTLLINRYGWTGFDPLASIFIAALIFASVVPLVMDSGSLLVLDMGDEREIQVKNALISLAKVEGVSSYSKPKFWSKDPETMIGSICIQLSPSPSSLDSPDSSTTSNKISGHHANIDKVRNKVIKILKLEISGLENVVIEIQPTGGFSTN